MNFFGLTSKGFDKPISDYVRPDYEEPTKEPRNIFESGNKNLTLLEKMRVLDPYIGNADGFAYNSINMMKVLKRKKMLKPVGPMDIYVRPAISSQVCGWWMIDPLLKDLNNVKWIRPRKKYPYPSSEMSKYLETMQKNRSIWVI